MNESTLYWLWLRLLRPLSDRKALRLLEDFHDPMAVFAAEEREIRPLTYLSSEEKTAILLKDLSLARAEQSACEALGVFILTMRDEAYPKELLHLPDPPMLFYAKGDVTLLSRHPKLTVVGTRHATPQGVSLTIKFAKELSSGGAVIVSGMADGIDAAAHTGALRTRGKTVAILGCGIDVPYPAANIRLKEEVGEKGLLLSEFPLGMPAHRNNFPYRNRVLSALSEGTLVMEAGQGSGALITAKNAVEQGKNVYALPWDVEHIEGLGGNQLLKSGGAEMALSAAEIMRDLLKLPPSTEEYKKPKLTKAAEPHIVREKTPQTSEAPAAISRTPQEEAVLRALKKTDSFDDLLSLCGIPAGEMRGLLVMMQIKGLIEEKPGKRYYKKQELS